MTYLNSTFLSPVSKEPVALVSKLESNVAFAIILGSRTVFEVDFRTRADILRNLLFRIVLSSSMVGDDIATELIRV
jgi:hypothetical protein